ncbi:family 78 glycoside hydrolase catalytic domain [Schumannella luteola]
MSHPHSPSRLLADGRPSPLAADSDRLSLSWRPGSDGHEAVIVEAASSAAALENGDADRLRRTLPGGTTSTLWEATAWSRDRIHWRVGELRAGTVAWSDPAALERPPIGDWGASWISDSSWGHSAAPRPLPVLSRRFELTAPVESARLYLAAAGVVSVRLNGRPANDELLAPGYATYSVELPAVAWDVTDRVALGDNTIEIELAGGAAQVERRADRYSKLESDFVVPRVLVSLEIRHSDGTLTHVVSDKSWTAAGGPTAVSHWYGGEDADPGAAGDRRDIAVHGTEDLHRVRWVMHPPIRHHETLTAVSRSATGSGSQVFDFGTNVAGWQRIRLADAPAGRLIVMRPAELLGPDGHVDQWSTGSPIFDSVVTTGEPVQSWHPELTYHGFRYLEVEADAEVLECLDAEALVLHASNEAAGSLELSDLVLQQLHRIIRRSVQGNMFSVFTDCPHREKLGWIEQLYLCFGALARNYDVQAHLRDEVRQLISAQLPSGSIPSTAPEFADFSGNEFAGDPNAFREDPNWGGALVHVPWLLYREYGDELALREAWPAIERYLEFLHSRSVDGMLDFGLGDWIALDMTTPRWLVATTGYCDILESAIRIGPVMGADVSVLRHRLDQAHTALIARVSAGGPGLQSQGALALILDHELVSGAQRSAMLDGLVETLGRDGRFTLGENALPSLIRVLADAGRDELLARIVRNPDAPGYGYQIARGATSLSETWTSVSGPEGEGSQNHFMLGMIHDWLHARLAGLDQHADSVAWEHIVVAPTPIEGLDRASTRYETPRGTAAVTWQRSGDTGTITVTVPPTARATVVSPWELAGPDGEAGRLFHLGPGTWTLGT